MNRPTDRTTAPTPCRRERQLRDICSLAAEGDTERASALAAEHLSEFPDDAEMLREL